MIRKRMVPEYLVVLAIAVIMTAANSVHVITQWLANPADRLFAGIAHYYADYFLYISQFAQGSAGRLFTASHRFSNEPMKDTWIYWFNVLLGWIGGRFGLSPFASYNTALILLVFTLLILWYRFSSTLYPRDRFRRIAGFIAMVTASSFFLWGTFRSTGRIEFAEQYWFAPHLAFIRLGGVPHQVFQTIVFLLLVMVSGQLMMQIHDERKTGPLIWMGLGGLVMVGTSANPQQMMVFLLALGTETVLISLRHILHRRAFRIPDIIRLPKVRRYLAVATVSGVLCLPVLAGTLREFDIPVFNYARNWEMTIPVSVTILQFLYFIGPAVLFIPFGIYPYVKSHDPTKRLYLYFGAIAILIFFSPIPRLLNGPAPRFLHPASYGVLGILTAEGMAFLGTLLARATRVKPSMPRYALLGIYAVLTLPALYSQVSTRGNPDIQNPVMLLTTDWNHIPRDTAEALTWLSTQPDGDRPVVLMDNVFRMEILVPAIANKIVFSGHPLHTQYFKEKETLRDRFFTGGMNAPEQQQFLINHRIGWIVTSPAAGHLPALSALPFLTESYRNSTVVVYRTQ